MGRLNPLTGQIDPIVSDPIFERLSLRDTCAISAILTQKPIMKRMPMVNSAPLAAFLDVSISRQWVLSITLLSILHYANRHRSIFELLLRLLS